MKIVALMAWYDEPTRLLWQAVRSLEDVADHLIAVDGAYRLFPRGKAKSPSAQHKEIAEAAAEAGITHEIIVPKTVWENNEIEKRTAMFGYGEQVTTEDDWFLIVDADDAITYVGDFRPLLEKTPWDVGAVDFEGTPFRKLFRARRGIYCEGAHYVFKCGDDYLWGNALHHELAPCTDVRCLKFRHDQYNRPQNRIDRKSEYYQQRNAEVAETIVTRGGREIRSF